VEVGLGNIGDIGDIGDKVLSVLLIRGKAIVVKLLGWLLSS
tara:strand:+ start:2116 stop:2238 length:123 start_codon:yes stop_codon:yes gene_type:complete